MKKNRVILLTLLMSMVTMFSFAQVGKPKTTKVSFGIKGGANVSTIINSQVGINFTPEMNIGYVGGIVTNIHFGYRDEGSRVGTGYFGIQPEVLYSNQGFSVDGTNVDLNYITVPVMFKFYATKGFSIELGPYFSYLLSSASDSVVIDGAQIMMKELEGNSDYGAAAGISFETKGGFMIGVRYNMGFANMANNLLWRNNNISTTVGWLF